MRKKLLTVAVGSVLAMSAGVANAIDLKVSGTLNRALMWADDGNNGEHYNVDASTAPSRLRFLASDDVMPGVKAGVNWEVGLGSNRSHSVTQETRTNTGTFEERWQEVYFQGAFGKLGMGQGEGASKDTVGQDISGTGLAASGAPADIGGGLLFKTGTGAMTNGPALSTVLANYDSATGGARYDRVRYDSPSFGGVVVSGSFGYRSGTPRDADTVDVGVKANLALGGGKLAAGLGYSTLNTNSTDVKQTTINGSVSYLSPVGVSVTLAYAQREDDNPTASSQLDGDFARLKVGYLMGEHAVSVHYAVANDQLGTANDDEATQIGAEYVYTPKPWFNFFAGLHTNSLDRKTVSSGATTEYEDLLVAFVGARVSF